MRWLNSLFGRVAREQEFDRELQFHVEQVTRDYLAQGMRPEEAPAGRWWISAAKSRLLRGYGMCIR